MASFLRYQSLDTPFNGRPQTFQTQTFQTFYENAPGCGRLFGSVRQLMQQAEPQLTDPVLSNRLGRLTLAD